MVKNSTDSQNRHSLFLATSHSNTGDHVKQRALQSKEQYTSFSAVIKSLAVKGVRIALLSLIMAIPMIFLNTASTQAAPVSQTTPLPTSLTINNTIEPGSDPGLFNLLVNAQPIATGVASGGTTGAIILPFNSDDPFIISIEAAPGTELSSYSTTITCTDNNGVILVNQEETEVNVDIVPETQVICEVSHVRLPGFTATLNDVPWMDTDGETEAGDIIQLTAVLTKTSGLTATNVVFSLPIDPNSQIVSGTATTNRGIIALGSMGGDPTLMVTLGNITDTTPVSITVNVMVNTPLPSGVDIVTFQGIISADNAESQFTDDPSVPALIDPTQVSVTSKPLLNVTHANRLLIDSDADGLFSPGDRIYYEVTIINIGNGAAQNLEIVGTIDANTSLVSGTVSPDGVSVTTNPITGATEIAFDVETVEGGGERVVVRYQVMVNQDITATSISSQFEVTADEPTDPMQRIQVLSDDPTTLPTGDATVATIKSSQVTNGVYLPFTPVSPSTR